MSETGSGHRPADEGEHEQEESRAPHRVIGTPPPAQARTLLGDPQANGEVAPARELPAGPEE